MVDFWCLAGTKLFEIHHDLISERYETLHLGGGGASTTAVCAVFEFNHPAASHLIKLLPKVIAVEVSNSSHRDWIESTLRLMAAEARRLVPNCSALIVMYTTVKPDP